MNKKLLLYLGCLVAILFGYGVSRRLGGTAKAVKPEAITTNIPAVAASMPVRGGLQNQQLLEKRVEEYRQKSEAIFQMLVAILTPYGVVDSKGNVYVQRRTNGEAGIKIEVQIRTSTHQASFIAGPVDPRGVHINKFLPEGPLLTQFESLYDGSDTRRKPDAADSWHKATGKWSEQEAIAETLRLMRELGVSTNQMVKYRFNASSITVKDTAQNPVRVTPFYKVDLSKDPTDEVSSFLSVEYRIDDMPPAKVTRLWAWPPIQIQ